MEMMASEMPAAISPYSIAVAPDSSVKKSSQQCLGEQSKWFPISAQGRTCFAENVNWIVDFRPTGEATASSTYGTDTF